MPGFDPDQPRDEKGQWTDGGGSSAIQSAASDKKEYYVDRLSGNVFDKKGGEFISFIGNLEPEELKQYGIEGYIKDSEGFYKKVYGPNSVVTNPVEAERVMTEFRNKEVTKEMERAVQKYTGAAYYELNRKLREYPGYENTTYFEGMSEDQLVSGLEKFIDAAPKYNGDVYRGIKFENEASFNVFKNDIKPGAIIEDKGFVSTTVDPDNVQIYAESGYNKFGVRMKIRSNNGVYVAPLSEFHDEKEVMFKRKSKFKVVDSVERPSSSISGAKVLDLTLEEL